MSTGVFQTLSTQYQEASEILSVLEKIVHIQNTLELATEANKAKDFSKAADALLEVQGLLGTPITENDNEIKIVLALHEESCVQKEKFLFDLGDQWKELIAWNVTKVNEKTGEMICKLKIDKDSSSIESLQKVVLAMKKFGILEKKIQQFGNQLLKYIFKPLISDSDCQFSIHGQTNTVEVKFILENRNASFRTPSEVFSKLGAVLYELLGSCFNNLSDVKTGEKCSCPDLMDMLGSAIADPVLELLKECLKSAIPTSNQELESFQAVISMTQNFHRQLVEIHFINDSNRVLPDLVQNINVLFANKKCQAILEKARKLMETEIHNTVLVSSEKPLGELPLLGTESVGGRKKRKLDLVNEIQLSSNTFRLPKCHIR